MTQYVDYMIQLCLVLNEAEFPEISYINEESRFSPLSIDLQTLLGTSITSTLDIVFWKDESEAVKLFLKSGAESVWRDFIVPRVIGLAVEAWTPDSVFYRRGWKDWIAMMIKDIFEYKLDSSTAIDCAICFEKIGWKFLQVCGHYFHSSCINTWKVTHNSCPLC